MISRSTVLLTILLASLVRSHPPDEVPNYLKSEEERLLRSSVDKVEFRLNDDTYPIHYDLKIVAFLNPAQTFEGEVQVTFKANRAVSSVVINQQNINVKEYDVFKVVEEGENELLVANLIVDREYEKFTFELETGDFNPDDTYLLYISYDGTVHNDMRGFYESYYLNSAGRRVYLDTTHFGQQARRLVPCWDEPDFKASWKFTVHRNFRFFTNSLTNAMIESTSRVDDIAIDVYKTTAPIPAYILGLVVSDFRARSDAEIGEHTIGIYARPNAYDQTEFAYDNLLEIVKAFDEWTGLSYFEFKEVDKIDMAAIPDFSAGGKDSIKKLEIIIETNISILISNGKLGTFNSPRGEYIGGGKLYKHSSKV